MMKVIVNCTTTKYIGPCLESLRAQLKRTWRAFVTLDPCVDGHWGRAVDACGDDGRIQVVSNTERRYSLRNQIDAIARSGDDPEDVIVSLDGDDWFTRNDALGLIAKAYESGAWMTYGSWFSPPGGESGTGNWPAYPEGLTDFRHHRWLATAVRTWKRWLWEKIDDSSLRDDEGEYFRIAEDRAIMYPLLEMCGTERARHIAEPIMFYNQQAAYSEPACQEADRNVSMLVGRSPYTKVQRSHSKRHAKVENFAHAGA